MLAFEKSSACCNDNDDWSLNLWTEAHLQNASYTLHCVYSKIAVAVSAVSAAAPGDLS